MDVCTQCKMYMKPFVDHEKGVATCEFCGEVTARKINNKWERLVQPD